MVGFDFASDTVMRDALSANIGDNDPMIAVAAVQTLAQQPSTVELVRNAAANKSPPQVTRDAASAAANPQ